MMATFPVTLGILLAVAVLGSCQVMDTPGAEPWSMVVMTACQMKGVDASVPAQTAGQCLGGLTGQNPFAACGKIKERDACLRPYYDVLKKCFDDDGDVEKAFEAQKGAIEFFCEDGGKKLMEMTPDQLCTPKDNSQCMQQLMMKNMPEFGSIFTENNCKAMGGFVECLEGSMEHCEGKKMRDMMLGQIYKIMERTPCKVEGEQEGEPEKDGKAEPSEEPEGKEEDEPNGASISTLTASILLFSLLCNTLT